MTRWIKIAVGRKRPYRALQRRPDEDNVSFPSGHTSTRVLASRSAPAIVARMRGYKSEPYVWVVRRTLATTSAYLRIAADKHYLTDVLGGAAIGTACGLTVPS